VTPPRLQRLGVAASPLRQKGIQVAVLNTIELEGVSAESWKEAAHEALREASRTLRNIRRMDVLGTSATVADGGITEYRAQVRLTFEVETAR
jgi:dodecin